MFLFVPTAFQTSETLFNGFIGCKPVAQKKALNSSASEREREVVAPGSSTVVEKNEYHFYYVVKLR